MFYAIGILVFVAIYTFNQNVKTIEEYEISSGFGNDIERNFEDQVVYSVPYSIYDFQNENENKSFIKEGKAKSIGETRGDRSLKSGKAPLVGLQKIIIISEEQAEIGIKAIVNILFSNPKMNDRSLFIVCKGNALDILNFKVTGCASSSDFIEGMIKRLSKIDFFLDEYSLLNTYVALDAEGRNLAFPYLELINNELKISGMTVFKEDKMLYNLDLEKSKIMNMLRGNKSRGTATLVADKYKSVSYSAQIKRHVKCQKKDDGYLFNIQIDCLANIISSKDYKVLDSDAKKKLEQLIKKDLQEGFTSFINTMQNEYKLDMLQLGFIAASKYGKDTGVDWDEEVSKSKISIDVKVKVQNSERGEY